MAWDSRAELHFASDFYDVEGFRAGRCSLNEIELQALGDVRERSILHLQCHFGQDSLSLARRGALVTGVDFSPRAIAYAKSLSEELGLPGDFICADVLEVQLGRRFDTIFVSYGAICWLPDLDKWADTVLRHLVEGGDFVLVEFHPTLMMFDFEGGRLSYDYFFQHYQEQVAGTYAAPDASQVHREHFWTHGLAEVMTPLLARGLRLVHFEEYDYSPYGCFPSMREEAPGRWRWESRIRFPHTFKLHMKR